MNKLPIIVFLSTNMSVFLVTLLLPLKGALYMKHTTLICFKEILLALT